MSNESKQGDIRILVVEDDWFARNVCISTLRSLGYENILSTDDGKTALDIMAGTDQEFSLIILDLNLPELNGIKFIQKLHDMRYSGALIILSGEDERLLEATYEQALQSGIHILDAIPKPIEKSYLAKLLEKVGPVQ